MTLSPTSSRSSGSGSGGAVTTIASSGASRTLTPTTSGGDTFDITLTANTAFTLAAGAAVAGTACILTLFLRQDSTGSRVPTWPSSMQPTPTLTTTAGDFDIVSLITIDGGVTWSAVAAVSGLVSPGVPAAPSNLAASALNAEVDLTWTAPTAFPVVTGNKVYRGTTPGGETLLTTLGVVNGYNDTGLANGTTYYYKVRATNADGDGTLSSEVNATPVANGFITAVLALSPNVFYRMNEPSGTTMTDSSGASNTGSYVGGVTLNQPTLLSSGGVDTCAKMASASSQYGQSLVALNPGDVFTYGCLIKRVNATAQVNNIMSKGASNGGGTNGGGCVRMETDGSISLLKSYNAEIARSTTQITDTTTPHLIIVTKNAGTVKIYIDGVDRTGSVSNLTCQNNSNHFWFGADGNNDTTTSYTDLYIGEGFVIVGTAITSGQVSTLQAAR